MDGWTLRYGACERRLICGIRVPREILMLAIFDCVYDDYMHLSGYDRVGLV